MSDVPNRVASGVMRVASLAAALMLLAFAGASHGQQPSTALENCSGVDLGTVTVSNVERFVPTPMGKATRSAKETDRGGPKPAENEAHLPGDLLQLRDTVRVTLADLPMLMKAERCSASRARVVLFLDGRPVKGAFPDPPGDPKNGVLLFQMERREDSRQLWTQILGRPRLRDRYVTVSVGLEDGYAVAPTPKPAVQPAGQPPSAPAQGIYMRALPRFWLWLWTGTLVFLLAVFLVLAAKSDVLRDPAAVRAVPIGGGQPGVAPQTRPGKKPYSLARMQAAFWFFLVLTSWGFLGLVTGDYDTVITPEALALMGISAATAIGSATIDDGRAAAWREQNPGTEFFGPPATGHWYMDILSDASGVNFHRFQMAVWTLVLGIVWVHDVWAHLAMPEFSVTLLGLMGISAGTYLGLKTTSERPKPP
ncbi:hypothetical protein ACSFA0_25265 [Variovorax sp. LT1P1]|uniref:hypothetical protein n=1 Tax=Variovorax sp. LT1P1 TaxID=3443730 RepID=UPI003F45DC66